jgi:hypothetical protein
MLVDRKFVVVPISQDGIEPDRIIGVDYIGEEVRIRI